MATIYLTPIPIDPLDTFDSKYIEDIPPVSKIVTHRKYQRGRCTHCGKEVRHDEAVHGPPVSIGPNLAVYLTLMNQMGTTFRKLSTFSTRVLGTDFQGIVMCDFYAAYNCLGKTERCLVHLLRDIKKERGVLQSSKLLKQFESKVKELMAKGLQVQTMDDGPEKERGGS